MVQRKDVGRGVSNLAGSISESRQRAGAVIEAMEQRMLLAAVPVLDWSSYLGGSGIDMGSGIAVDASGNAWVAGSTSSLDFANGGFDTSYNGQISGTLGDTCVAKINANGTLAWSSYLGGSGDDFHSVIAVDGHGNAWLTGKTNSIDLATGGFDTTYNGGAYDDFVAKINADGILAWVSYLGGSGQEGDPSIAIDGDGNAWVTAKTNSTDMASGGFDTSYNGGRHDEFVAKIKADGTLAWVSYLGGSDEETDPYIAIDGKGDAWVTGATASTDFARGGFDTTLDGPDDAFVAKINANGTLAWSSYLYLGFLSDDSGSAIAIDDSGNAWVAGLRGSVAKINADGTLAWSTYRDDTLMFHGIAIDHSGNAWVTGKDPIPSPDPDISNTDAVIAKISPTGTLTWLTYLGGRRLNADRTLNDSGAEIAIDSNGGVWVTGQTSRPDWTSGGFDTTLSGPMDGFVMKISETPSIRHAPVAYDQSLTTSQNIPISSRMAAYDPDADPLTYTAMTQPTHGTLSFTPGGTFTYTPQSDFDGFDSFTFKASDSTFDSNIATVRITITHDLQANISLSPSGILENQPAGTLVGAFSVSGPDAVAPFTYSLVSGDGDDNNASFTIAGGQLLSAASFDYETKNSYSIRVRATDSTGHPFEQAFTITVMNVNEAPTDIRLGNTAVPENQRPGLLVGTLNTTDPDKGDTFTYSLVDGDGGAGGDDNASFTISGNWLHTAASFSLADQGSYSVRIRTTDAGGLSFEKAFTIYVVNTLLSNDTVPENRPSGTAVGTFSCANPDFPGALTYTLIAGEGDQDNDSFTIAGNQLLTAASFNFEAQNTYSIRIRSTVGSVSYDNVFLITVTDVNEVPTDLSLSNATVQENLPSGTVVGTFMPVDPDADDSFTYTLVNGAGDDDNAVFAIDGGQLTTAKRFNYEFRTDYSVRVQVTDSGGLTYEQALDIQISDDPTDYRGAFGRTGGKKAIKLTLADTDGDLVTFKLGGTGMGKVYGFENSFEDLFLTGVGPKSAVTITVKYAKVKKPFRGDKLMTLGNVTSDGPIKSINAPAGTLSGLVQLNTLDMHVRKVAASLKLRQITDSDIRLQNLPVSSIAVKGDISGTRLVTDSSIKTLKAATLLDSDILVGMGTGFAEDCAFSPADFANSTAWLGNLKISGRKLPSKAPHPADVSNSHISAPSVGTLTLMNVADTADPMVHVANDLGTLKVTQSKLANQPLFPTGTWKTPGARPAIWEVL